MSGGFKELNESFVIRSFNKDYRLLDAFGDSVIKYKLETGFPTDDTTGDPLGWTSTVVEAGTGTQIFAAAVTAGDVALITTAAADFDGGNYQLTGEAFKVESGKPFYFGARLKLSEATQSDLFIGLAETDTTLMATSSAHAIALGGDGLFFSKLDAVTTINAKNYLDGSETGTAAVETALDTSYHWYEIDCDGTNVHYYFDGELVTTFTADIADGDMTPSINVRTGSAAAITCSISNLVAIQLRS